MACWRVFVAGIGVAAAGGCGEDARKAHEVGVQVGEAARQVEQAAQKMGEALAVGSQVEPIDFRELKLLLPESVAGLKRVRSEGARSNVMGIASSRTLAAYEDGKGARLEIELIDAGTLTGLASVAFGWIHVEIDKEGDGGYERTTTLAGRKAFERYSKKDRAGELDVMVAGRFVVSARGTGIDMKTFREALGKLDLDRLEAMKSRGAPATLARP